jgi:hypothetical protein
MLRRDRVVLLALSLFCLLPAIGTASQSIQGGYLMLINGTPYDWQSSNLHSVLMNRWGFPAVITAGSTATVYVAWPEGDRNMHSGDVTFSLAGTDLSFQVKATLRGKSNFDLSVVLTNFSTLAYPQGSTIDLGWKPSGVVNFILAGQAGSFTTNRATGPWMHANLGVLGDRSLRHLCMPGSHDAGMSEVTASTAFGAACNTVTQYLPVLQQLQSGARYFDIRPVISGGQLYTGHYSDVDVFGWQGASGQSIASVIDDVNAFTATNQELVVLYLTQGRNTDVGRPYPEFTQTDWNRLLTDLLRLNHRFVTANPTTVDLTTLTLRDFIGSQAAVVVVVDPGVVALGSFANQGFYAARNFTVYNQYAASNDLKTMIHDQLGKLQAQRPNPDASYFLLSWTLTQNGTQAAECIPGLDVSVLDLAAQANPYLYQLLLPATSGQTYPNILYIDGITSSDIAALAMAVNSRAVSGTAPAYLIYKGTPDSGVYVAHSSDSDLSNGDAWSLIRVNTAINTSDAPAAVFFGGVLHFFYKGSGNDARIYVAQPVNGDILEGGAWNANPLNAAINTSTAPGVAIFNNTLYLFYKGAGGDTNIYIAKSAGDIGDGSSWSASRLNPAINTSAAPAAVAFGGALYMFYKGSGGDTNIYVGRSTGDLSDGNTWSASRLNLAINTSTAPGAVVYNGSLYMFYKGSGGDTNIYLAHSTGDVSDGSTWSAIRLNPGINTTAAPKPVVIGNSLYLFYKGSGDTGIWIARPTGTDLSNGDAWQWERLNSAINTSTGPGAAAM